MANTTRNFLPADPNWKLEMRYIKASTAIAQGAALYDEISGNTTTGYLTKSVVESASGANFQAILMEAVAAADADYATALKKKLVAVPRSPMAKAFFTVGAGTFSTADIGKTVEVHSDSVSLAVDTAGKGATITDYISSTRGKCRFNLPNTETA